MCSATAPPAQPVEDHSINIPTLQPNSPALAIHRHALLFVYKYINFNLELLEESQRGSNNLEHTGLRIQGKFSLSAWLDLQLCTYERTEALITLAESLISSLHLYISSAKCWCKMRGFFHPVIQLFKPHQDTSTSTWNEFINKNSEKKEMKKLIVKPYRTHGSHS